MYMNYNILHIYRLLNEFVRATIAYKYDQEYMS